MPRVYVLQLTGTFFVQASPFAAALGCSLSVLDLRRNRLTGTLPAEELAGLSRLQTLNLAHNRFNGT